MDPENDPALREFLEREKQLALAEVWDPLRENGVRKVQFVSHSKGWRNGKQIWRKYPKEVTLLRYGKRCVTWNDTPRRGLDAIAMEVLGTFVHQEDVWDEFSSRFEAMEPG